MAETAVSNRGGECPNCAHPWFEHPALSYGDVCSRCDLEESIGERSVGDMCDWLREAN